MCEVFEALVSKAYLDNLCYRPAQDQGTGASRAQTSLRVRVAYRFYPDASKFDSAQHFLVLDQARESSRGGIADQKCAAAGWYYREKQTLWINTGDTTTAGVKL